MESFFGKLPKDSQVKDATGFTGDEEIKVTDLLHICQAGCGCEMVYPLFWKNSQRCAEGIVEKTYDFCMRCPECEHIREGRFNEDQVEAFDEVLNQGTEDLLAQIKDMARSRFEQEVEVLVAAINNDHLLPEDF